MIPDKVFPYYKQSKGWANYLSYYGWKNEILANGARVLILPTIFGGLAKIQRPENFSEESLREVDSLKKKYRLFFVKLEPGKFLSEELLFSFGYVKSNSPLVPPSSLYIDLDKPEEELWNNLSRSGKYGVNRANREGTRLEIFNNPSDENLKKYRKILKATEKRKNFISLNYKELLSVRDSFLEQTFLFFSYNKKGELTGGRLFIGNEHIISYVTGAASSIGLKDRSGYKLYWDAIKYFNVKGYTVMDLEGCYDSRYDKVTKGYKGFTDFKIKFGTYRVTYPGVYVKVYPKYMRFLSREI